MVAIRRLCFPIVSACLVLIACGQERPAPRPAPASQPALGINLASPFDWNTELPFVDVFRTSRPWISQRDGQKFGEGPKLDLDEHGWIRRLEAGCWAETPILTGGHAPVGEYVVLYDGKGRLQVQHNCEKRTEEQGRIVVHIDGQKGGQFVQVRDTDPKDPIRNIRVLMPGTEKTAAKEPFTAEFLARWRGMKVLRFMNWQMVNEQQHERWSDRPTPESATWSERGVPVEVMVDLCNRLRADPWFCLPIKADDDYLQKFASYVKAHLAVDRRAWIELSNEIWNFMFPQTRWAVTEGRRLGLSRDDYEAAMRFSSQRSVEMFRVFEKAFGGNQRLVRVMAAHAAVARSGQLKLEHCNAYQHCDALAIAPYISVNISGRASAPGLTTLTVRSWSVEKLLDHVEQSALPECVAWMKENQKLCARLGVAMVAYEAGQHLIAHEGGENDEQVVNLLLAANRHERMHGLYLRYLDAWQAAGGSLCCLFSSTSPPSKWGCWGLYEYAGQALAEAPKARAAMEWLKKLAK